MLGVGAEVRRGKDQHDTSVSCWEAGWASMPSVKTGTEATRQAGVGEGSQARFEHSEVEVFVRRPGADVGQP